MNIKKIKELGLWLDDDLSSMEIDEEILAACDTEIVKQYAIVPFQLNNEILYIATANEKNYKISSVLSQLTGKAIKLHFTTTTNVSAAMAKYYQVIATLSNDVSVEDVEDVENVENEDENETDAEESALSMRTHEMLILALDRKATDVHILPKDRQMAIFFRINAELVDFSEVVHSTLLQKKGNRSRLVAKIKAMCVPGLQTSSNMPQSGAIPFNYNKRKVDCRVSVLPTVRGENVVIRLLDEKKEFTDLDNIGYAPETLFDLRRVLARPGGLIMVTGPVNSGKSTSLYACINNYDFSKVKVYTIEDPVENKNEDIAQIQVRRAEDDRNNLTFAKVLREILRADPNVILVGEIRDQETADIAVMASLTGHKVFSTLHNKNVIATIDRLMNMGVDKKLLLSELSCVVSQRLISTVCKECSSEYQATLEDVKFLNENLRKKLLGKTIKRAGQGNCTKCNNTGYAGLAVVEECIVINNNFRDFLSKNYTLKELTHFLEEQHFVSMQQRALDLVLAGKTTIEKYLSTMPDEG